MQFLVEVHVYPLCKVVSAPATSTFGDKQEEQGSEIGFHHLSTSWRSWWVSPIFSYNKPVWWYNVSLGLINHSQDFGGIPVDQGWHFSTAGDTQRIAAARQSAVIHTRLINGLIGDQHIRISKGGGVWYLLVSNHVSSSPLSRNCILVH